MSRKTRPYLFYDTTTSVCTSCLRVVEAKILIKGQSVFLEKWCPAHGTQRVLIADDADYYRSCREVFIKEPELPQLSCSSPEASRPCIRSWSAFWMRPARARSGI